jgi:hypothetical protein
VGFEEIGCKDVDWFDLFQDRVQWRDLMKVSVNLGFYEGGVVFVTGRTTVSF